MSLTSRTTCRPKHSRLRLYRSLSPYGEHILVPIKDTVCGLAPPLSLIETAPPPVERDQVTLMSQELPAATLAPQVFVWEKGPEIVMPLMFSVVLPTLVSVVVSDVLQTQREGNMMKHANRRLVGESFTTVPVPLRETLCGLPGALSVTDNVPVRVPPCVGLNATLIVQLAPAARLEPQEVWVWRKSPLAVMLVMLSVSVP